MVSGRFGNQADQFLGALAFIKSLDRTMVLPPWVEYGKPGRKPPSVSSSLSSQRSSGHSYSVNFFHANISIQLYFVSLFTDPDSI